MRRFVAYLLIAITLLSNGMVDFAIKVCHDSEISKNSSFNFHFNRSLYENSNPSLQFINTSVNFQNIGYQFVENKFNSKNHTELLINKRKNNCCSKSKTQTFKHTDLENQHSFESNPKEINTWTQLKEFLFNSDEHPCCADNSNVQIKCCTSLNLYYFTPKFLEEFENPIPQKVWQNVASHFDSNQNHLFTQSNFIKSEIINRSDQIVPCIEDISSNFCVWII
jgi:hypothetical protein